MKIKFGEVIDHLKDCKDSIAFRSTWATGDLLYFQKKPSPPPPGAPPRRDRDVIMYYDKSKNKHSMWHVPTDDLLSQDWVLGFGKPVKD